MIDSFSFQIAALQADLLPGMRSRLWMSLGKPGQCQSACAPAPEAGRKTRADSILDLLKEAGGAGMSSAALCDALPGMAKNSLYDLLRGLCARRQVARRNTHSPGRGRFPCRHLYYIVE
ncbi:MAG: hypothetical protein LBI92_06780 [Azoarcus sp.]|jgi:hypothetical protein|nr:hypothetical protein [Azoarcus sp.]